MKYYQGIKNLKTNSTEVEIDEYKINEFIKVKSDIIYFTEKFIIKDELSDEHKKMLLDLIDHRKYTFENTVKIGDTTINNIFILWYIIFNDDINVGIASSTKKNSKQVLSDIKKLYVKLPLWIQCIVKKWNANGIKLSNGSQIICGKFCSHSFRGWNLNVLYNHNVSKVSNETMVKFYDSIIPILGSKDKHKFITEYNFGE
jgi:hypothetical protein